MPFACEATKCCTTMGPLGCIAPSTERVTVTLPAVSTLQWTPSEPSHAGVSLEVAGWSHPGRVRPHNEDAWLADPPMFVVADGMGGHEAGDIASRLVVEAFSPLGGQTTVTAADVERCITVSRTEIDLLDAGDRGAPGSTVVAAAFIVEDGHGYWLIANVGDSRAYTWEAPHLERLSHDHSLVQELVDSGQIDEELARSHPDRHVITRAIGALEESPPEYALVPVTAGSMLLLCSDGLTSELSDVAIALVMAGSSGAKDSAERLVRAAVEAGGHDNVTVVVVDVKSVPGFMPTEDTLGGRNGVDEDTIRTARP